MMAELRAPAWVRSIPPCTIRWENTALGMLVWGYDLKRGRFLPTLSGEGVASARDRLPARQG